MKIVVGLGNPGRSYSRNRHNVGFMVIDSLAVENGVDVKKRSFGALVGKGLICGENVLLVKPQTFMNLSGDAVSPLVGYYKLSHDDLIVLHDDMDIDAGRIKISKGAGNGGHNGVRSIIDSLGRNDFLRIRLGVGRPPENIDSADYVLANFNDDALAQDLIKTGAKAVCECLKNSLEVAQQKFNITNSDR